MIIVIPARGGSKRILRKNICLLNGKPLLSYTLELISAAGLNIPAYVSTDDEEIAQIARSHPGIEVVIRPANIASDTASTESVLLHVLDIIAERKHAPKWLMTLPPTSPFRSVITVRKFFDSALRCENHVDCLMSVTENRGDFWRMQSDGRLQRLLTHAPRRQQDRSPLFEENSAVYVSRTQALRETNFILGREVRGITIPAIEGFDINQPEDLRLAECLHSFAYGLIK